MARKKTTFETLAVQFAMTSPEEAVRAVISTMTAILKQRCGQNQVPKSKPGEPELLPLPLIPADPDTEESH